MQGHAHFDGEYLGNNERYKSDMGFGLAYLRLTFTYSKGQGQGHADFRL